MKIWLISDTHFSHKNTLRYCGRPFFTIEQCDRAIVDRCNQIVGPEDILIHLGDVAMHTKPMLRILPQLKVKKRILIIGNHDLIFSPYFLKTRGQKFIDNMMKEYAKVFDEIYPSGVWLAIEDGKILTLDLIVEKFVKTNNYKDAFLVRLSHFPTKNTENRYHNDKHDASRPIDNGMLNICGHVHQNWLKRGNNINVGVDVWDFTPVKLETVIELWKNGPKDIGTPKALRVFLWTQYHTLTWRLKKLFNLFKSDPKQKAATVRQNRS